VTGNSAVKSAVKPRDKVERRVIDRMDTLATTLYEFAKHDPDISSLHEVPRTCGSDDRVIATDVSARLTQITCERGSIPIY